MSSLTEGTVSLRDRVQSLRLPNKVDDPRQSARGHWLPWMLCGLLGLTTASLAYTVYTTPPANGSVSGVAPAVSTGATESTPASTVPSDGTGKAASVTPGADKAPAARASSSGVVLESKGYIIPAHQIQVSPIEVGGRVVELFIEEGKRFKQGDVLAVLDKAPYEADVAEAKAALASAENRFLELKRGFRREEKEQVQAELSEAEEQLRNSAREFKRAGDLRGTAVSAQEYELSEATYRAQLQRVNRLKKAVELILMGPREEKISAASAEVDLAKARLRKAEWRLENCTIRAPVSGTILTKSAEVGNLVNPMAFGASSKSLCDMADLRKLEVDLGIVERDLSKVFVGQKCKVRCDAFPDRIYEGVVDRLMPIANRSKGEVPVRVQVKVPADEEGVYLKPEMGAIVSFLAGEAKK